MDVKCRTHRDYFETSQRNEHHHGTHMDENVAAEEVHTKTQLDTTQHSNLIMDFDIKE